MLQHVHIKNFTIIDEVSLDHHSGFTVITGETGAGKSIIIDAIELALGQRATTDIIRDGCDKTDISISFDIRELTDAKQWLDEHDIDADDECIIRRTINTEGRSKSYINGIPVTLQTIKELGALLINIHGQHEFQTLLNADQQRKLLDHFAQHAPLLTQIESIYYDWRNTQQKLEKLKHNVEDIAARKDYLNYQIKELVELSLLENEIEQLETEHKQLANAEAILKNCHSALSLLSEDENQNIESLLNHSTHELSVIEDSAPQLINVIELLNNANIQLEEAAKSLRHFLNHIEINPDRLQTVEERLRIIYDLARKHQVAPNELIPLQLDMEKELATLESDNATVEMLDQQLQSLEKAYFQAAKQLTTSRQKAAKKFGEQVTKQMQQLGMPHGQFEILLEPIASDMPHVYGMDKLTFLVSTNPKLPLRPLTKVASGGELSRISLAIQVVTAQHQIMPILIFDEVDVGIGGAVAEIVGNLLRQLGEQTQIFCITHLAQVAAKGHQHLKVEKTTAAPIKITVSHLQNDDRLQEIARMTGGLNITQQTLAHAKEMMG